MKENESESDDGYELIHAVTGLLFSIGLLFLLPPSHAAGVILLVVSGLVFYKKEVVSPFVGLLSASIPLCCVVLALKLNNLPVICVIGAVLLFLLYLVVDKVITLRQRENLTPG